MGQGKNDLSFSSHRGWRKEGKDRKNRSVSRARQRESGCHARRCRRGAVSSVPKTRKGTTGHRSPGEEKRRKSIGRRRNVTVQFLKERSSLFGSSEKRDVSVKKERGDLRYEGEKGK